jgi:DNA polymerase III alpha subunit
MIVKGLPISKLAVTHMTPELKQFNMFSEAKIGVKTDLAPDLFPPSWNLPDSYKYLDVDEYLIGLIEKVEQDALYEQRLARFELEINLFSTLNLYPVLRTLIYVLDEFKRQNVVWGVGRGSSCSSYLLYLLGLHDVDPVLYDIAITDFIRLD